MATLLTIIINIGLMVLGVGFLRGNNRELRRNKCWPSKQHQDMKYAEWLLTALNVPLSAGIYTALIYPTYNMQVDQFIANNAKCIIDYSSAYLGRTVCSALICAPCIYYVVKSSILIRTLKDEYEEYRLAFSSELMWYNRTIKAARKEQIDIHKFLIGWCIVLGTISTVLMVLAVNEYAYFDDDEFHFRTMWGKQEYSYSADEFETIYSVDYCVAPNGNIREDDYFVFKFKDGNKVEFRLFAKLTPQQLKYAREFTGLPIVQVPYLDEFS